MARKRTPPESAHVQKARAAKRESKHVEFKEQFDPSSDGEWCELIKDFIAIGNSAGGVSVIGLTNIGTPSGADVRAVLALDNAKIGERGEVGLLHDHFGRAAADTVDGRGEISFVPAVDPLCV